MIKTILNNQFWKLKQFKFLTLIFLIFLLFVSHTIAADTIRVASFNMQILGSTKLSRENTFKTLADIATHFDILAIQEVGSNYSASTYEKCEEIMETYTEMVNNIWGSPSYSFIHGDQYALVYRNDKLILHSSQLYTGDQIFNYEPLIANFEVLDGNFDFSIITIHTSPGDADSEIPALKEVMSEIATFYSEKDVICLGDFNADGSYYSEGKNSDLASFGDYITAIPNEADTTVAENDFTYDRIQMTLSMSSDYTKSWGVFEFSDYYDVSICEGTDKTRGTELALSDHYPVWVELYTNSDSD